jgi:hypothetical protein
MRTPDAVQTECLRRIAQGQDSRVYPCDVHVLALLLEAGPIERMPRIWLPLQPVRMSYRVTPLGEQTLHDCQLSGMHARCYRAPVVRGGRPA